MKQLHLQRRKSPFDWLFSRPAMVAHCLHDDFATLLDPAYHRRVPVERRRDPDHGKCSHLIYDPMTAEPIFNHHDPLSEPKDRDYFERTVADLRASRPDAATFFVMITVWPADLAVYETIADALAFVGDPKLLVVDIREGHPPTEPRLDHRSGTLEVVSVYPRSHLDGISFGEDGDDAAVKSVLMEWLTRNGYSGPSEPRLQAGMS